MSTAIASALSGIRSSLARMDASASRLAGRTGDPVDELVDQISIKANFQANIKVLETANETERGALRLWA